MSLLFFALQDFDADARDAIALLDPQTLRGAFERLFRELAAFRRARASLTDLWGEEPDPEPDPS